MTQLEVVYYKYTLIYSRVFSCYSKNLFVIQLRLNNNSTEYSMLKNRNKSIISHPIIRRYRICLSVISEILRSDTKVKSTHRFDKPRG